MPDIAGCGMQDAGGSNQQEAFGMQDAGCSNQQEAFGMQVAAGDNQPPTNGRVLPLHPASCIPHPVVGTLLAFDFGTQRIGVATGNTFSASAAPLLTISEEKNELRFAQIAALIKEWQPAALVVGLPCNDDGTPHQLTALCHRFAKRLHGRFGLKTLLVDERYTSLAASSELNKQGIHGRGQKSLLDQYAAQQILQAYLDEPAVCKIVNADRGITHE